MRDVSMDPLDEQIDAAVLRVLDSPKGQDAFDGAIRRVITLLTPEEMEKLKSWAKANA